MLEWRRKEKEKWSFECLAGLRVWKRCPVNHQWDNQTWPAAVWHQHHLPHHTSPTFSFSRRAARSLGCAIYSAPSCFLLVLCVVLFYFALLWSASLLGLCSSHTALYCSVVLSSIKQREHVIVLTALWVRLSPRRFLSRGSFRDWNTKLKGTGGWIFNKQKHKGKKEKCGF